MNKEKYTEICGQLGRLTGISLMTRILLDTLQESEYKEFEHFGERLTVLLKRINDRLYEVEILINDSSFEMERNI